MRLFAAIELGNAVRQGIAALQATLRGRVERQAPRARLTWVAPERMHLTVRFIGEVDAARGAAVLGALRDPLPLEPFTVAWGGLGAFPQHGAPRVLWAGVESGGDGLQRLEAAVGARLDGAGVAREERPYHPHLTLARVRDAAGLRPAGLFADLATPLGRTAVEAITLFESRLSPKGPAYTVLQRTTLSP